MPHRRLASLDVKFPALMASIVIATVAVLGGLSHKRFEASLYEAQGARVRSSAQLVAQLLGDAVAPLQGQLERTANSSELRAMLRGGTSGAQRADSAALAGMLARGLDSSRVRAQIVGVGGGLRADARASGPPPQVPSWAERAAARGELSSTGMSIGPFTDVDGRAQFEIVVPIHARDEGESLLGFYAETRVSRGQGVESIRRLSGTSTLIVGRPGDTVWTDLERTTPAPPPFSELGAIQRFDRSAAGAGVGVALPIRGSPWVLWMQMPREAVLAPLEDFEQDLWRISVALALLAVLLAWLLTRRVSRRVTRLTRLVHARDRPTAGDSASSDDVIRWDFGRDEIDRLESAFTRMAARSAQHAETVAQLQQAQKLEAVGRMAGGIAHDFNNMLTVVTNYCEMVKAELPPEGPLAKDMEEVLAATERAARLTRQLLAFSRRQVLQPVSLNLNDVVSSAHRMLQRVLPSNIDVQLELSDALEPVWADPVQVEQVLLNLALNAADAMPDGGSLLLGTSPGELDELPSDSGGPAAGAQHFSQLQIRDTGHGMDRETAARAFEPFFTTKPAGKGTGLGLSSVHGIVTQLGGRIWLYSEVGLGTTIKIFLPTTGDRVPVIAASHSVRAVSHAPGTILVVEDDAATRQVTARLLRAQGFTVAAVGSAAQALAHLTDASTPPQLVLSDVMMPGMTGIRLGEMLAETYPELPLLLMSGYTEFQLSEPGHDALTRPFIEKPFTSASLVNAIWRAIDAHH